MNPSQHTKRSVALIPALLLALFIGFGIQSSAYGQTNPWTFITLAGTAGVTGFSNAVGTNATFNQPIGIAVDAAGNIYVADAGNQAIRKITPAGMVSTFAAGFNDPENVAVDGSTNVYVLDFANGNVVKITPTGDRTIFWSGVGGGEGIATDNAGNVYISHVDGSTILKSTPSGSVTSIASGLNAPQGITVDAASNVYVAETLGQTIRKITPDGTMTILGGFQGNPGTNDGFWTNARFHNPGGVAVDSFGNVFVAELANNTIRVITPSSNVFTVAGAPGVPGTADGTGNQARFSSPARLYMDGAGNIYATDLNNATIRKGLSLAITAQPQTQTVLPGSNVTFIVAAVGQAPLVYQWFFEGTNLLASQTNATLTLTNLTVVQTGNYSASVSNIYGTLFTSNAFLTVFDESQPLGDGIPNWWKATYHLSLSDPAIATNHPAGDKLTYLEKYLYGLNPLTNDFDGDGLSDYDEIFSYHSNPLSTNTAGDGIPDKWKVDHGLNPLVNNANNQVGTTGVTYFQIYQYNQTHTNQLDPQNPFFAPGTSTFEVINNGQHTNRYYYDREDRLLGTESSRGVSIGYVYDGNANLTRQTVLSRTNETNGLPVLWSFLNGLSSNADPYADPDGDGWSNYQEWLAGTNPNDPNSRPNLFGNPGTNIASLTLPFTPSNFVVGTGQLDGLGGDEIVIGGDGNPGTNTNFMLVLTESSSGWSTQRVDVGPFGITSIAIGQPTNRPNVGIYVGLRGITNGDGRVMEFTSVGGTWQSNLVTLATNQAAFVLGVRAQDVLVSLATSNAPDGSLSAVSFTTNWNLSLMHTNTSHRGLGTLFQPQLQSVSTDPLRLLDSGGILIGNTQFSLLAANLVSYWKLDETSGNAADSVGTNTLSNIQGVTYSPGLIGNAANLGNDNTDRKLARPDNLGFAVDGPRSFSCWVRMNTEINSGETWFWVNRNVTSMTANNEFELRYIDNEGNRTLRFSKNDNNVHGTTYGINYPTDLGTSTWHHLVGTADGTNLSFYVDGVLKGTLPDFVSAGNGSFGSSTFELGQTDRPTQFDIDEVGVWSRALSAGEVSLLFGNGLGTGLSVPGVLLPEPSAVRPINWRGASLTSGSLRGTNGASIFYSFTDDKDTNSAIDSADDFVTAEYLISGTKATLVTLSRQPISVPAAAQSYGLALVNFLNNGNKVLFTGEPDGQLFAWLTTGVTNPLQRQLFSAQYAGEAWHALAGVKTLEPGEGLAGLMVDPTNQNTCQVIFWPPQTGVVETAPSAMVLPATNALGSLAAVPLRLWDAEGNASTPFLQYQLAGSTIWSNATLTTLDGSPYSTNTRVAAMPGGTNHSLVWNALADLGGNIVTNLLLRARAQDFMLVGDWSQPTPFLLNMNQDANSNGIPDWWEQLHFGNLSQPANGDFDGDGVSNFAEYIADTDPANSNSFLHITGIQTVTGGVKINWSGGVMATQFLQRRASLNPTNSTWVDIYTNLPPTLSTGTYTDPTGTNNVNFYRIRAVR